MTHPVEGEGSTDSRESPVILLVEDEIFIRLASADWLRDAGFEVIEAADGAEALSIVHSGKSVDLLATDITMPGAPDGIGLARAVRELRPDVPILIISSLLPGPVHDVADKFVQKPYGPSELVSTVKEMVEPRWQNRTGNRAAC